MKNHYAVVFVAALACAVYAQPPLDGVLQGIERYEASWDRAENLELSYRHEIILQPVPVDEALLLTRTTINTNTRGFAAPAVSLWERERWLNQTVKSNVTMMVNEMRIIQTMNCRFSSGIVQVELIQKETGIVQRINLDGNHSQETVIVKNKFGISNEVNESTTVVDEDRRWDEASLFRWRYHAFNIRKSAAKVVESGTDTVVIEYKTKNGNESNSNRNQLTFAVRDGYYIPVKESVVRQGKSYERVYSAYRWIDGVYAPEKVTVKVRQVKQDEEIRELFRPYDIVLTRIAVPHESGHSNGTEASVNWGE